MQYIHKVIGYKGQYFVREYETIKHHKNKKRFLREETVSKNFLDGDLTILIHFEYKDDVIEINPYSSPEIIEQYLGSAFIASS